MARRLRGAGRHLGVARAPGRLYDLGPYPGLAAARRRGDWVVGDLYELAAPRALLRMLDRYEAGAAGGSARDSFECARPSSSLTARGALRGSTNIACLHRPTAYSVRRLRAPPRGDLPTRELLIATVYGRAAATDFFAEVAERRPERPLSNWHLGDTARAGRESGMRETLAASRRVVCVRRRRAPRAACEFDALLDLVSANADGLTCRQTAPNARRPAPLLASAASARKLNWL